MNNDYFQIVFVVETTSKAKTDCRYISEIFSFYFNEFYRSSSITRQFVYMGGKHSWNSKRVQSEIKSHIKSMPDCRTFVLYSIDMDNFTTNSNDESLISSILKHCEERVDYHCILFNKNIEHVLLGKRVKDSQKVKEVGHFIRKHSIESVLEPSLRNKNPLSEKTSNVLCVFDEIIKNINES